MEMTEAILECRDLTVDFGQQRALNKVSLAIGRGEIVGLVGPNGAGKSTLGRVLVGEIPHGAYDGELRLDEREVRFSGARAAHDAGVILIHQEGAGINELSIGENIMLTLEPAQFGGLIDFEKLHQRAGRALRQLGVTADTRQLLGNQGGVALAEMVEIARSIVRGGKLYVFDESTAALGADEIGMLLEKMRELAATGASVIFISHRLHEILMVCDRIVVLRDGRKVLDAPRAGLDHEAVVRAMLGGSVGGGTARGPRTTRDGAGDGAAGLLRLEEWRVERSDLNPLGIGPIDAEIRRGEILGVYGALGSGKTEFLHSLFGLSPTRPTGSLWWKGDMAAPFSDPLAAIARGVAFVSADRQKEGIVPQLSVLENMMLGYHRRNLSWRKLGIRHGAARRLCVDLIRQLGIRTEGPDQPMAALSGGNQQKVLLARAVLNEPEILLLDEPTRGIDVGAKHDVYRWIHEAAAAGTSMIISSLEEAELIGLADRILVLRDGKQVALCDSRDVSEHDLALMAAGGRRH